MNTILECFYLSFGLEIGHPLSTYATGRMEGEGERVIQIVYRCVQEERGITPHVYVSTYIISFHAFVLCCLVLSIEI